MPTNLINHHNNTNEIEQTTLQHTNEQANSPQTTGKKTFEGNIRSLDYITSFRILFIQKIKFQQTEMEIDHPQYEKWKNSTIKLNQNSKKTQTHD